MQNGKDYNDLSLEDIRQALTFIDPDLSRNEWVRILSAVKSELSEDGKDICYEWSSTGTKFNKNNFHSTWKTISQFGDVRIGTLIYEAQKAGFKINSKREKISQDEIDKRAFNRVLAKQREEEEKQKAIEFDRRVSNLSKQWWQEYEKCESHPYLTKKQIKPHNTRVGLFHAYDSEKDSFFTCNPNTLIIPMYDLNGLVGFQGVLPVKKEINGNLIDKLFLKGLKKDGRFSFFGKPKNKIIICEGWATGASIYEATDEFTVVAFDAGQLMDKAVLFRNKYPDKEIIIAADNDESNTGKKAAMEVTSNVSNCRFVIPDEIGDFNDIHVKNGINKVSEYFNKQEIKVYNNMTIDFYSPLPYVENDKGKPSPIIENFMEILDRIGAVVRYNVIKKDEEILIPDESFSTDNAQNATIARIISRCAQFKFPTGNISEYLTYISEQNKYNPVQTWINAYEWDGEDRLSKFLNTVQPKENKKLQSGESLHHVLIKRWMVSAVASALSPNGISSAGVLVFQGGQGLGKTKWFKSLVPDHLDLAKDGLQLRLDDKDSVKEALSYWLVELGELDGTFNKSEMAALKAFLTKSSDEMRQAYARKASKFARRTVFFASVNPDRFLKDSTGNRRYWTIACESIDYNHDFDMQQVWAQVYEIHKDGYGYYLTPEELDLLNESNEDFNEVDPIEELIMTRFNWSANITEWKWVTVTDALIAIGRNNPTVGDCRKAGASIRKLNEGKQRKSNGKQLVLCPPKIDYFQSDSGL